MNKLLLVALGASVALAGVSTAEARDGCGPGGHRGAYGRCRPNRGGPVVIAPGLVIGNYYRGRGYWNGHRYYQNRYRHRDGWRYR